MLLYLALIAGCFGTVLIAWQSIVNRTTLTYSALFFVFLGAVGTIYVTFDSSKSTDDLLKKSSKISQLSLQLYSSSVRLAASQIELKKRADIQANAQELLRKKSDEIAILNGRIAESQRMLREQNNEISARNKVIAESVTGREGGGEVSFGRPDRNNVVVIQILNDSKYPLYDVDLLINDSDEMIKYITSSPNRTYSEFVSAKSKFESVYKIGNIPPNSVNFWLFTIPQEADSRNFIVQTSARSGRTHTELKYKKVNKEWKYVGRTLVNGKFTEFGDSDFPKDENGKVW